ncbi:sensor domain-containing diguanylate cyclase [Methylobacterium sp. E-045]|uniref:GGDEF domain-containing protein n=1 Tax=Methylobacterium sp. E-045 TaxID=2836575 RepID=UPI001FBBBEB6|nr:sensor domain-containing diguanylate cyclase [Methylobacterium sp. E-045]MCJ2130909.1 sensor domain-containing diguanylate cyclase [Methylobacterium sp. E-045]
MVLLRPLARRVRSARTWIVFGILAPVGMLAVSAMMLLDLRRDAWEKAEQTSRNLLQVIERDIARNIEIIDLSLQGVTENLKLPAINHLSPDLRQLILFDRAISAQDMGVILVLDERGDSILDGHAIPARHTNNFDRDYFQAHKAQGGRGLLISQPVMSRLTGARVMVLSRRVDKPDGSFGGVVLGTLKLSYFMRLFDRIGLGRDGAINLFLHDGTRIMRYPSQGGDGGVNVAGAPNFKRFLSEGSGSFVGTSSLDAVERHYAFTQVGALPLILNVAVAVEDIEAEWRAKAIVITAIVVALCGLTICLSLLFGRELARRSAMQVKLARQSLTDALTGLPNRRRFEEALTALRSDAARPFALLVIDADHFKRYNDLYGHAVGDDVLRGLAQCLLGSVHRPADIVCRVGGEEFAILIQDGDEAAALRIAERVHARVALLSVESAQIEAGSVTVSIGVATMGAPGADPLTPSDLYSLADAALYEAKANGRNQTRLVERRRGVADRRQASFRLAGA